MPLILFISSVSVSGMNGDNTDSQKLNKIISEIQALQEVVARFRQLRLDATEFACLKCIVTFKAGKQKASLACLVLTTMRLLLLSENDVLNQTQLCITQ